MYSPHVVDGHFIHIWEIIFGFIQAEHLYWVKVFVIYVVTTGHPSPALFKLSCDNHLPSVMQILSWISASYWFADVVIDVSYNACLLFAIVKHQAFDL